MKRVIYLLLFVFGIMLGIPNASSGGSNIGTGAPSGAPDPLLTIDVYYAPTGQVLTMDLETYIKGVVASEMPVSAGIEALKAQAVAARTVAVRKMRVLGGNPSRPDADVTSDHRIDQAWNPESYFKERWGAMSFWLNWPKIERAVQETRGIILTYNGVPCDVVYHSTCAGQTEAAKDVWGRDVPYLQSVQCSFCQDSPYYRPQTVTMKASEVSSLLGNAGASVPVSAIRGGQAFSVTSVSPTGRIKQVSVNGKTMRGLEFRTALGLKSTYLSWSTRGDSVVFQVKGYGHGAGMCQYGAMGMAKEGRTYTEILSYYYQGATTAQIFEE
ncbi:MAG TPA: stage II sporulation protein D [Firmicutes bacterium]|nr:stage II sporulation protein D [Candidatus Fermentithermobacillaceae bacterium]